MTPAGQIDTLVLYAQYTDRLSYYDDWLEAFRAAPEFRTSDWNICAAGTGPWLRDRLREAELVVLLHSVNGDTVDYVRPFAPLLADRRGRLLSFVGNEVNLPGSPIADKRALFREIEPDYIATQLLQEAGDFLFGDLVRQSVVSIPHALNPDAFVPESGGAERPIDVGVRAVRYLPQLGDNDRNRLHDFFAERGPSLGLNVDISTQRLARADWAGFLNRCAGTVSTEAGSWYLERDDAAIREVQAWVWQQQKAEGRRIIANDSPLRRWGHKLPWTWRVAIRRWLSRGPLQHESAVNERLDFDTVFERFFRDRPRCPAYAKCISSRHFDAIGTKTCQIMFPGRFNGVLDGDEHYIALSADFSNLDDVLTRFRDDGYRRAMVDRTYDYVRALHTYRHRITAIADLLGGG